MALFTQTPVVYYRRRDDRDEVVIYREADLLFGEIAEYAVCGGQSESAPTGKEDGISFIDEACRVEKICLSCPRRSSSDVNPACRRFVKEEDTAAGLPLFIRIVAYLYAELFEVGLFIFYDRVPAMKIR